MESILDLVQQSKKLPACHQHLQFPSLVLVMQKADILLGGSHLHLSTSHSSSSSRCSSEEGSSDVKTVYITFHYFVEVLLNGNVLNGG